MDELISRRAAIEEIARRDTTDGTVKVYSGREVCDILNALPTAEQRAVTMKLEMDKDWVKKVMEEAELTFFAEPRKGRWIPVSERLPEEDNDVLISYRYKDGEGDTSHVEIDITSYGTVCFGGRQIHTLKEWRQPFDYFHTNYEVIAWMPLPEPYREEESDGKT